MPPSAGQIHEATLNTGSVTHNLILERLLFLVTLRNTVRDFTVWEEHRVSAF